MIECAAGIDFGTTKVALALVDPSRKSVLFSSSEDHGSGVAPAGGFEREQSVERALEALGRLLERLGGRYRFLSIGLTGQMHGVLGVDAEGRAVSNLVTWQDGRGDAPFAGGKTLLQVMEERAGPRRVASGYGVVTLAGWVMRGAHPNLGSVCTIADYAGMLLTGNRRPSLDASMADSIGAYDLGRGAWDEGYVSALGIDPSLLPGLAGARAVIGYARDSKRFPIPVGSKIPVAAAIGDNQASFIGSVKDFHSTLLVNVGTGSQVSFCARDPERARILAAVDGLDVALRPFVDGGYLVAGSALSGGVVYRALRDFFASAGRELFGVGGEALPGLYERMGELASREAPPEAAVSGTAPVGTALSGAETLEVYPLLAGKRSDPRARGRIGGMSLSNFTPANLIRGTLEGEMRILREMLSEAASGAFETLVGSGNGIRRNAVLRAAASRVFGKPLLIPVHEEEAALGAALHGAVAGGAWGGYEEGGNAIEYRGG